MLVESRKTYHLEEDRPDLIARATALAAGPVEEAGHEPGELIAKVTCPCCGASLGVEYGDDEGEIGVVGDPAAPVDDPALKEAVDVLREVLDCRLVLSGSGDQVQAGNLIASNNPSLHSRASALVQRHGGTGGREGGEAMNPTKSYRACENCGRHLSADSPPPPRAYERGEIHIDGGSLVLLPNAVVKEDHVDGYSDSHAANISGAYCDLECLVTRIRNILHVNGDKPRVNKRKAREARR